jgi:linoleoyl-CoA desaturase
MRVKFAPGEGFYTQLKDRIDAYFQRTGFSRHDNPRIYVKIAILLTWLVASYVLLVFVASTWWQALPLALSLGLATAGIGFNLGHDGGHGSVSRSRVVNRLLMQSLDLVGASSYIWHFKHNVFHHSYPNILGADEDIDSEPLARFSPHQRHRWFHRFQFIYMWLLYGFLPLKWQYMDDFLCIARGKIAAHSIPRPQGWQLVAFVTGKLMMFSWTVLVPVLFHPLWVVAVFYFIASYTLGVTLSVVFQLAHTTDQAAFPQVTWEDPRCENEWAVHQVLTTVDFARHNWLLDWYLGGLNYQIEHHLFPHVTHIHYPALSAIVETTCAEHGVRYFAHKTFTGAVLAHTRWLRRMGRPPHRQTADPGWARIQAPSSHPGVDSPFDPERQVQA